MQTQLVERQIIIFTIILDPDPILFSDTAPLQQIILDLDALFSLLTRPLAFFSRPVLSFEVKKYRPAGTQQDDLSSCEGSRGKANTRYYCTRWIFKLVVQSISIFVPLYQHTTPSPLKQCRMITSSQEWSSYIVYSLPKAVILLPVCHNLFNVKQQFTEATVHITNLNF